MVWIISLKNIVYKNRFKKKTENLKRSTSVQEMESVVKNQPTKCLSQTQTIYPQVLPNIQGTHNSNLIHTVPENGKRRNIYQFILWDQYNQTKAVWKGKTATNLTYEHEYKKSPRMKLNVDHHSFIHPLTHSVNHYLLSINRAPAGTVLVHGEQKGTGASGLEEMGNKANDHTG